MPRTFLLLRMTREHPPRFQMPLLSSWHVKEMLPPYGCILWRFSYVQTGGIRGLDVKGKPAEVDSIRVYQVHIFSPPNNLFTNTGTPAKALRKYLNYVTTFFICNFSCSAVSFIKTRFVFLHVYSCAPIKHFLKYCLPNIFLTSHANERSMS